MRFQTFEGLIGPWHLSMPIQFYLVECKQVESIELFKKKKKVKKIIHTHTPPPPAKKKPFQDLKFHRNLPVDSDGKVCRKKVFASIITK